MKTFLNRDEVRNSAFLAMWLDPNGSFGFEGAFLSRLLQEVKSKRHLDKLPATADPRCRVRRVESYAGEDQKSRVGIEIDDPRFFFIIEVKIDTPESDGQLYRYCDIAKKRSNDNNRPWAILFLTPQGRLPRCKDDVHETALIGQEPVIPFSWKEMSLMLSIVIREHALRYTNVKFPKLALDRLLAREFCNHIHQF